ncbi:MYND-type zinc finger protein samB like [Verticillium longisporum]|nr:MYND-type zinc finger protein samB like [Verticillium longisporum]
MREVNFSIPNVNKASVGITTALYDRRALDCTSTLPLINSLNHLAYLTTSSARIRDILTVDGGIERLVCILKRGRSKDMMDMWKWNLAFQCVVNIGVRGTENVRTRVVEADMVPVIATILDNYIKVIEKCREKAEEAKDKEKEHHRHRSHEHRSVTKASSFTNRSSRVEADQRSSRRQAPPPSIDVSATYAGPSSAATTQNDVTPTGIAPQFAVPTATERQAFQGSHRHHHHNHHHHHHHHHHYRPTESRSGVASTSRQVIQPLATAIPPPPPVDVADAFVRPVRDVDRLASMAPFGPLGLTSQPTSPTTPLPPPQSRSPSVRPHSILGPNSRARRRPSIRHQNSTADSDDLVGDDAQSDESPADAEMSGTGEIPPAVNIQDITMEEGENILAGSAAIELTPPTVSETQETGAFNISHRGPVDGSIANNAAPAPVPPMGLSPNRQTMVTPPQPSLPNASIYSAERGAPENVGELLEAIHPVIRTNPVTGWKSVFAVGHHVQKINGLSDDESKHFLAWFVQLIVENHDLQVRFKWRDVNDVAIWDNRSVYHAATPDYLFENLGERQGSRAVSLGERPYFDPRSASRREAIKAEVLAAAGQKEAEQ